MKLCRYRNQDTNEINPGIIDDQGTVLDVSFFGEGFNEQFFATEGSSRLQKWILANAELMIEVEDASFLCAPFCRPSKIIAVGLNYSDHAEEVGAKPPVEPILFYKATSGMAGPFDPILKPLKATKLDYEVELAVVIGKPARNITEKKAMDYVAGYTLANDLSERDWQLSHKGQWLKGKSHDSFAAFGPFLATKEHIEDPLNLNLWLKVNGEIRQQSNTSKMLFSIPELISYTSRFMTLLPGDIICTGTPAGVGMASNPPKFLEIGDEVSYGIDGLGAARKQVLQMGDAYPTPFCFPSSASQTLL